MAQSLPKPDNDKPPKPRVSIKVTRGKAKQVDSALDLIAAHLAPLAPHWPALTHEQREQLLAHSPVLARYLALAKPFFEVRDGDHH